MAMSARPPADDLPRTRAEFRELQREFQAAQMDYWREPTAENQRRLRDVEARLLAASNRSQP